MLALVAGILGACDTGSNPSIDRRTPATLEYEPAWAPTDSVIAYTRGVDRPEIWLLHLPSLRREPLFPGSQAAWSRDGTQVAFVQNGDVFVYSFDRRATSRVTFSESCNNPTWAPTGDRIACDCYSQTRQRNELGVVSLSGQGRVLLAGALKPAWSPDGAEILVEMLSGQQKQLFVYSLQTNTVVSQLTTSGSNTNAVWSVDGAQIAWEVIGEGIHVMHRDGSGKHHISNRFGFHPTWAPSGDYIAFVGYNATNNTQSLWWMQSDGTDPQPLGVPE